MPNQPRTPNIAIRVEQALWQEYRAACEADNATRSDDLRAHMRRKVRAWKRRKASQPVT